ncbi:helix-loop-helix DNA-binding domain-containing protein [Phycomyces nitens]|nr:helix-loop-helix DNA-binding domain-containing protein [Phycomyces nitens]
MSQQPLKLRNPTQYHLMASQQSQDPTMHPLATAAHSAYSLGVRQNRDSPSSDHLDFPETFSQNFMSPMSTSPLHDFDDLDYQSGLQSYQKQHTGKAMPNPRSGQQDNGGITMAQPIQMKQNNQDFNYSMFPNHADYQTGGFPMSAPATMGYEFGYPGSPSSFGAVPPNIGLHAPLEATTSTGSISANHNGPRSYEEDYAVQMNMQIMVEKRRRRRESHNAVERRRRDNINDRIQELGYMLPDSVENNGPNKPNKGAILRKSVDHIRQLQQDVSTYSQRVKELERTLQHYRHQS